MVKIRVIAILMKQITHNKACVKLQASSKYLTNSNIFLAYFLYTIIWWLFAQYISEYICLIYEYASQN